MNLDWKKLVSGVAPMIGTALGGPMVGGAVAAVAKAIGLDDGASEDDVAAALASATPETLLKLKQADNEFRATMAQLGFQNEQALAKLAADDRDSARRREIEIKDKTPSILAGVVTLGFFGVLAYLMGFSPPSESRDVLNIMLGSLGTAWVAIISYYFGSSAGSERKTALLAKAPQR